MSADHPWSLASQGTSQIKWPNGKKFAFTIIDDTDAATVENAKPVYDLLTENGLRTTKTVWPLRADSRPTTGGDSLEDAGYRDWILDLQGAGFEIALHGVADGYSSRERIKLGLRRFREIIGNDPAVHINHVGQTEGIYWGSKRFDQPVRGMYRMYRRTQGPEVEGFGADRRSQFFWGDLCQQGPKYVRNLVFKDINTLKMDPLMPYSDPRRPFVRRWFSASNGSGIETFCKLISQENQDRLEAEGGACILYTHLGSTFQPLRADLKGLIRAMGARKGWFVPVATLLEYLGEQRGWCSATDYPVTMQRMQWQWLGQQVGASTPARKTVRSIRRLSQVFSPLAELQRSLRSQFR